MPDVGSHPVVTPPRPFQFRLWHLLLATALVGLVLSCVLGVRQVVSEQAHQRERLSCINNLSRIAMALQLYHDDFGSFPPAYVCDESGKPIHSWRALILPYFQDGKNRPYDFDEPWDGPNNSALSSLRPVYFACPTDQGSMAWATSYVAVVGEDTIWPGSRAVRENEIGDGAAHTVLLLEIGGSNIHWLEPRDLPVDELRDWLQPSHQPRALQTHVDGGYVVHADGEAYYLPRSEALAVLRATVTRVGKEKGPVFDEPPNE